MRIILASIAALFVLATLAPTASALCVEPKWPSCSPHELRVIVDECGVVAGACVLYTCIGLHVGPCSDRSEARPDHLLP